MEKIRIALVEDQHLFRQSLSALIRTVDAFNLTLEVPDGKTFLEQLKNRSERPDIALVDINMPEMNGLELNDILHKDYRTIKVIILSVHAQERLIAKVIHSGACAYLNKNCDADELITAINTVYKSDFYINNQVLKAIQNASKYGNRTIKSVDSIPIELTNREKEILQLICQEFSNAEISQKLFLSVRTVEGHRNNLLLKTGCRNSSGLVLFAVKYHIFEVLN